MERRGTGRPLARSRSWRATVAQPGLRLHALCANNLRMWRGLAALFALLIAGCAAQDDSLARVKARGALIVAVRNYPTIWYEGPNGDAGFEYDLARAFAERLGVKIKLRVFDELSDLFAAVEKQEVDLAAAGITWLAARAKRFRFGPPYLAVHQEVVCRRDGPRIRSIEDAARKQVPIYVAPQTSYEARLSELARTYPQLVVVRAQGADTIRLLREVWLRRIPCTVADSHIVATLRRFMPELAPRFAITGEQRLAWLFPKRSAALAEAARAFLRDYQARGELKRLKERYFGHLHLFDYVDTRRFLRAVRTRLGRYRPYFEAAARRTGFDWRLLAAQAWVESRWDPYATSPTGVRGIMMLTKRAARELGVKDRLDPRESIMGGAIYLWRLHKRIGKDVPEPDRTWLALAAYTIGMGHVRDAQGLAQQRGLDPKRWADVAEVLPELMDRRVYRRLKHGYAHGIAAVRYVERIRYYQDLIVQATGGKLLRQAKSRLRMRATCKPCQNTFSQLGQYQTPRALAGAGASSLRSGAGTSISLQTTQRENGACNQSTPRRRASQAAASSSLCGTSIAGAPRAASARSQVSNTRASRRANAQSRSSDSFVAMRAS